MRSTTTTGHTTLEERRHAGIVHDLADDGPGYDPDAHPLRLADVRPLGRVSGRYRRGRRRVEARPRRAHGVDVMNRTLPELLCGRDDQHPAHDYGTGFHCTGAPYGLPRVDDVVFVDAWPVTQSYTHGHRPADPTRHVHLRTDGRCVQRPGGQLCGRIL